MGKGGHMNGSVPTKTFTWDEVQEHTNIDDRWIVVDGNIYDVTRWQKKHPGGARLIGHFAGQDATEVWTAMHNNKDFVRKYMKPLLVGQVKDPKEQEEVDKDFDKLRIECLKKGFFKTEPWFFVLHLAHIIALDIIAYLVMYNYGTSWLPYMTVVGLMTILQAQGGWTQHDYGHHSVFNSTKWNHFFHSFVIGSLKGASPHWWNFRHFQHHSKPNVINKDPDIEMSYIFVLGDVMPVEWGKAKKKSLPHNHQHNYFWILGPPFLLPIYFNYEMAYFLFKRKNYKDFLWMLSYFVRLYFLYSPFVGGWGVLKLFMIVRTFESFWFVFTTQMNHIPMEIDHEQCKGWVKSQLTATCNVDQSFFNDWFTGHLNFQIEHHLFPTMPRHNYVKVQPLVKELLKKHNIPYVSKTLLEAIGDILKSLKKSGQLWYKAYYDLL